MKADGGAAVILTRRAYFPRTSGAITPAALRLRSALIIAQSRFGPASHSPGTGVVRTVIRSTLLPRSLSGMTTKPSSCCSSAAHLLLLRRRRSGRY